MGTKKYSSYAEIDHDLKILKVEREIHYKKIVLSIDRTKESLVPSKSVSFVSDMYDKVFSGSAGKILNFAIPYLIQWFINKKRGD
ncbi:MAG TPA: DUF6327 family protein [Flavobacterium sp.]|uniref:DUF6327 family protein n=1 Tax=Flavobacterium sp. TaxID=239 RepID=UPI002CA977CD|nr:DUF6327 family protein [Flavobacterium sp.]HNP32051.1 DUF6327 family protein [Flavobacterium sp.]